MGRPRLGEVRRCLECGSEFYVKASEIKKGGGKYCTQRCRLAASYAVMGKICVVGECDGAAFCRDMCKKHYAKWHRANQSPESRAKRQAWEKQHYQDNRARFLERDERRRADPEVRKARIVRARVWAAENPERVRDNARRSWAKRKYGLSLEEADAIIARGCAICGVTKQSGQAGGKRGNLGPLEPRLCIDHDHTTGAVRDALCHRCNAALGLFADDPHRLRAAAEYIESHKS